MRGWTVKIRERFEDAMVLALKKKEGTSSQGCRWPLEIGKHKEIIFPQSLQREN